MREYTNCVDCYVRKNGKTLMLFRNKKEKDINKGKWIGLGGKFEPGESPEECCVREVKEEAGITLTDASLRGVVTFVASDGSCEPLYLFLFTAENFEGEITECDEGTLSWVDDDKILDLELWEGDRMFWKKLLAGEGFFTAKFVYDGEALAYHKFISY